VGLLVKVWLDNAEGAFAASCAACEFSATGGLAYALGRRHAEENPNHAVTHVATETLSFELRQTVDA
jgi:hypothetical protein